MILINLSGRVFGRWTVLRYEGDSRWLCRCDCGKEEMVVSGKLRTGKSKSCGCARHLTHGLSDSPTYNSWCMMKARCSRPSATGYQLYGGRGITVCERWAESFEAFLEDMGERPYGTTLDRIDVNGPYCADNCCWATAKDQCRNRRETVYLEYLGRRLPLLSWAEEVGLDPSRLRHRINAGWSIERALTPGKVSRKGSKRVTPWHSAFMQKTATIYKGMRRRAEKVNMPVSFTLAELRAFVRERVGADCIYSKQPITIRNLSVDHCIPLSRGGRSDIANLQVITDAENRAKGKMTADEYMGFRMMLDDFGDAAKNDILGRLKAGVLRLVGRPHRRAEL